jgi:hypothetical protein
MVEARQLGMSGELRIFLQIDLTCPVVKVDVEGAADRPGVGSHLGARIVHSGLAFTESFTIRVPP